MYSMWDLANGNVEHTEQFEESTDELTMLDIANGRYLEHFGVKGMKWGQSLFGKNAKSSGGGGGGGDTDEDRELQQQAAEYFAKHPDATVFVATRKDGSRVSIEKQKGIKAAVQGVKNYVDKALSNRSGETRTIEDNSKEVDEAIAFNKQRTKNVNDSNAKEKAKGSPVRYVPEHHDQKVKTVKIDDRRSNLEKIADDGNDEKTTLKERAAAAITTAYNKGRKSSKNYITESVGIHSTYNRGLDTQIDQTTTSTSVSSKMPKSANGDIRYERDNINTEKKAKEALSLTKKKKKK